METKIVNCEPFEVTANRDTVGFIIYEIDCISGDERGDFHINRDLDGTETLEAIITDIMEKCDNDGGVELCGHITTQHGICLSFHCDAAELRAIIQSPAQL